MPLFKKKNKNNEKQIKISVSPDGRETKLEAFGYKGSGCADTIAKIAKAAKAKVKSRKNKPEYFEKPDELQHRHSR